MEEKKWMCDQCNRLYESTELKWDIVIEEGTPVVKAGYCLNCGSGVKLFVRSGRWSDPNEEDLFALSNFIKFHNFQIVNDGYISCKVFDVLKSSEEPINKHVIKNVILGKSIPNFDWFGETYCLGCGEHITFRTNKTGIVNYISVITGGSEQTSLGRDETFFCTECAEKNALEWDSYKNPDEIKATYYLTLEKPIVEISGQDFIDLFVSTKVWLPETDMRQALLYMYSFIKPLSLKGEYDEVKQYMKRMKYSKFLQTPYWKAVAGYLKLERKKCEICGSKSKLEIHHTDYSIRGDELNHALGEGDKLQCLCHNCHSSIHGV